MKPLEIHPPTLGRIVLYQLNDADADAINRRRDDFMAFQQSPASPPEPGQPGATGHQAHFGNRVRCEDQFPAMVVATFGGDMVNLKVQLDGTDVYWATSRHEGTAPGTWCWPPRV